MLRIIITAVAVLLGTAPVHAADVVVFESGRSMRVDSYYVVENNVTLLIDERSEMVIPLQWIREIRSLPAPPGAPELPEVATRSATGFLYADLVQAAARKHEVDWKLVAAVMRAESNYNERAISRKGAIGLMQLMPGTADLLKVDPWNTAQNIDGGTRYLKMLLERYEGDLNFTLAAYNAGPKAVDRYQGVPPFDETRKYVKKVLQFYRSS